MPGIKGTMHEFKAGTLHSRSSKGPKVTNRKQAIAIGMSEQRKETGRRMNRMMVGKGRPPATTGGGAASAPGTSATSGSFA